MNIPERKQKHKGLSVGLPALWLFRDSFHSRLLVNTLSLSDKLTTTSFLKKGIFCNAHGKTYPELGLNIKQDTIKHSLEHSGGKRNTTQMHALSQNGLLNPTTTLYNVSTSFPPIRRAHPRGFRRHRQPTRTTPSSLHKSASSSRPQEEKRFRKTSAHPPKLEPSTLSSQRFVRSKLLLLPVSPFFSS